MGNKFYIGEYHNSQKYLQGNTYKSYKGYIMLWHNLFYTTFIT